MKTALQLLLATAVVGLCCLRAGAADQSEPLVTKLSLRDAPVDLVLDQLRNWAGKKIDVPADIDLRGFTYNAEVDSPLPKREAVALLREYFEKQVGIVFDELPDGTWQARLVAWGRDPKADSLVCKNAAARPVVLRLGQWTAGRKIDASFGVLKCEAPMNLSIYAASRGAAVSQLCDALEQQAGIVATDLPDGTLQLRLKTGDNDPIVPKLAFLGANIGTVLSQLRAITGKKIVSFSSGDFVGRSLTLHLENTPSSQVYALVRDALEQQAEVVLADDKENPFQVNARLTPAALDRLPRSESFNRTSVHVIVATLQRWTGKTIQDPQKVLEQGGAVTLAFQDTPTKQAVLLVRDALIQQAGIVLDELPDGNFSARQIVR